MWNELERYLLSICMQGTIESYIGHQVKVYHSFMHSFIKDLQSTYYMTTTRLGIRD